MKRRPWLAVATLVVAMLVGAWLWGSQHGADRVTVAWSPSSPTCQGTQVDRRDAPVIEAVPGMRCVITVRVRNDGPFPVHVGTATAPVVGVRTGAVVSTDNADPPQADGLDASFTLDRTLAPGRAMTFDIVTVFHPAGCNNSGTMRVARWPQIDVSSLGLRHERAARETFAFSRDGSTPGCSLG